MSIAKKIFGNTAAQIIGKLVTAIIAMATLNILSRYFTISELANYGYIFEHLALFGAIADMGIYTLVLREMSKPKANKNDVYGTGFSLRIVLSILAMGLAILTGFLAPKFYGTSVPFGMLLAGIGTFFVLMSGTASVVLQYFLQMRYYSYSLIGGKLIGFIGVLIITQWFLPIADKNALYWIVFSGTIGSFFIFLFTFVFSEQKIPAKLHCNTKALIGMFKAAIPFGIMMILTTLYFRTGFLMMRYVLPESDQNICSDTFCGDIESGKYLVSLRMMEVLLLFPIYFMNSMMPFLTKNIEEKSSKLPKIFSVSFLAVFTLALPMSIGGALLSTPLAGTLADTKLLSTAQSFGSDTGFLLLSISLFFAFVNSFSTFSLIALGKQTRVVRLNIIAVVINISLNLFLIPKYGLLGAGISTLISEIIIWILIERELQKYSPFPYQWKQIGKIVLASSIMGLGILVVSYLPWLNSASPKILLIAFPVALALYFFSLLKMNFFTQDMKNLIKKR